MRVAIVEECTQRRSGNGRLRFLKRFGPAWQSFLSRGGWWCWPFTILVAVIYAACFASFIERHTAFPSWDGHVYLQKTRNLAETFYQASVSERLNPARYFEGIGRARPPLLMAIAEIVLGPNPSNAAIGRVWLTVRVTIILLALYLLSREFGTTRFVPAAALVIFASPLMCDFYRIYMMDEPFGAFGLLAFTLILIDDRRQTTGSAFAAAAGILALFLVKPVAPAFVFPFCVIRAARALLPLREHWPLGRPEVFRLLRWALPYLLLLGAMVALLYGTAYGPAIRAQYAQGSEGYWQEDVTARDAFQLVSLVLPPWLLLTLAVLGPFARRFQHQAVLLYLLGGMLWWLLFSFVLTYTVSDRLLGQAMPYVVTATLLWVCQRPRVALAVTTAAALFFVCNTLVANGGMNYRSVPKVARVLSPLPWRQQPVPEVGLLPFARKLNDAINDRKPTTVYALVADSYVAPQALNIALRMSTPQQMVLLQGVPRTLAKFDLAAVCQSRWFITKTRRRHAEGANRLWITLDWMHALITHSESPLHASFRKVLESPIRQPDLEDTLVLWHLPSPPPDQVIAESLRWLQARTTNAQHRAVIQSQLEKLSATNSAAALFP